MVFEVEDGTLRIGERELLRDADLWLERGEHVSLVGPNGSGKTTLIRALAGERELDGGKLRRGHNVKLGLLTQHAEELGSTGTVIEACQRATGLKPNETRALLGQFLFSGEEAEKPLDGLSGGERRRLSLAILVHSGANVLILDEPTNHLDLESREALEAALQAFPGALLLISHDRALLDAVGSRTVAVEDSTLHSYVGGWPEYVRVREERAELERRAQARQAEGRRAGEGARPSRRAAPAPRAAANGGPSKNQQRRAAQLEREIERGGGRAGRARGRAGRPAGLERPALGRVVDPPPRRGEGARRVALRASWRRRVLARCQQIATPGARPGGRCTISLVRSSRADRDARGSPGRAGRVALSTIPSSTFATVSQASTAASSVA